MVRRSRDRDDNGEGESFRVNFKGVTARVNVPDGDYRVSIESFKYGTADSGFKKVDWHFKVLDGPMKGNVIWYTSSLQKQALWRLRQLLATAGVEVPEDELEIDRELVLGATLIVKVVYDEEYDNNKVVKFMVDAGPVKRASRAADEDEEAPRRGPGRPRKPAADDEDEPRRGPGRPRKVAAAEADDEDEPRRGRGRPRKAAEDEPEDEPAPRRGRPARGRDEDEGEDDAPRRRTAARDAPDDEDEPPRRKRRVEPEDEPDDEPAPRRRRAAADEDEPPTRAKRRGNGEDDEPPRRRRAADDDDEPAPKGQGHKGKGLIKLSADDVEDMSQSKLDSLIDSYGLDLDLGEYTTLRKMQSAVTDALETIGMLKDA